MIRKLKLLSVLAGIVAITAVSASPAQATFTSAKYPATISGSSGSMVIDAFGSTIQCVNNSYSGTLTADSTTLTLAPIYLNCVGYGLPVAFNSNGCDILLHKEAGVSGTFDMVCPGEGMDFTMYSDSARTKPICHVKLHTPTNKSGYTITNNGNGTITITGSANEITMTQSRTNFLCPAGTHTTEGKYTFPAVGLTLSGNNGAISVD